MLDLRPVSLLADYFVIGTTITERQSLAILDAINDELRSQKIRPLTAEGNAPSGWVLLDYGSVVLHLFAAEEREFYQLEELWREASVVLKMV